MGNTASNVTSGVKNQVNNSSHAFYQLVNLGGSGDLIGLAKAARTTGDTSQLVARIVSDLPQFLYNGGDGATVPIWKHISMRHLERTGNAMTATSASGRHRRPESAGEDNGRSHSDSTRQADRSECCPTKQVCWDVEQRGSVGETALHACFLCGSSDHMLIGRQIMQLFPKLINDVYLSDEYYGESILHMAIVNESPDMVRFLLKHGADVHQRCCGNFFTATDQKTSRTDSAAHESVDLCLNTDYSGHMYWGEYPLSFAACLSQEESFRLLIAKGADPNVADSNGNTVLHITVIHELPDMFDLACTLGAQLNIHNRQGLTPLTLAATLAKKEMFEHVLETEGESYWTYGGVRCVGYPLQNIDSIQPLSGKINEKSALTLVVFGNSGSHLSLLEGLLENVIRKKWDTYGKRILHKQLSVFVGYFLMLTVAFFYRPTPTDSNRRNTTCYLHFEANFYGTVRLFSEASSLIGAILYLCGVLLDLRNVGSSLFFRSLFGFPAKTLFLLSCFLILFMLPLRLLCWTWVEDTTGLVVLLLSAAHFLYFCRGIKFVGPFVLTFYKILIADLSRFFIIYFVFVLGFAQSFYIVFMGHKPPSHLNKTSHQRIMTGFGDSVARMFIMSLNEFGVFYEELGYCKLASLGKALFIVYILLVAVMLINMLIAMMTKTYMEVCEKKMESLRQWAAIILVLEQGLSAQQRLLYQKRYSVTMRDGRKRAFVMKWRLSEADQQAMEEERVAARAEIKQQLRARRDGLRDSRLNAPNERDRAASVLSAFSSAV